MRKLWTSWALGVFLAAGTNAVAQDQLQAEEGPVVIPGETLPASQLGPVIIESMEVAIERDLARVHEYANAEEADAPKQGKWAVPSPGAATHAHSGQRYLVNKYGATQMGIGFPEPVELVGAAFAGQGTLAIASQCLKLTAYLDGQQVGQSDWLYLDPESRFFEVDFGMVDRLEFQTPAMLGGAAFFGMDDLTYIQGGQVVILDFEDANHKQILTGSDYAGLEWELGSPGFRTRSDIVPAPQSEALPQRKGGADNGGQLGLRGLGTAPTLGLNFEGVRRGDAGQFSAPPDTHGAIGPNHFVITVNFNFAIYDKSTGAELTNIAISSFLPGSVGDPRVLYDQYSDRWVVINDDFSTTVYLAVSETNDPTGNWFKTSIVFSTGSDTGCFPDYPTLGVDANGIYIGSYMVGCGMSIFAIDKAPLIAGVPSLGTVTAFRGLPFEGALQPVHTYGAASGAYIISTRNTSQLAVRQVTGSLAGTPSLTDLGSVPVTTYSEPPDVEVLGAATPLDSVSSRLMNAVYRDGNIYTAHAVNMGGRAGVRWYEIDAGALSVIQTGDVSDPSLGYVMPTICVNAAGDIALGFSGADASTYASAYYAGRLASDPVGEMSDPVLLKAGEASHEIIDSFGRNRFGDYSQTSLDPDDELTFWTVQEWVQGTDIWSTWVGELQTVEPTLTVFISSATPELIAPSAPTTVTATIIEGTESVQTASLLYRLDGGAFQTLPLSNTGGNEWEAAVPGPACGDAPEWYISVTGDGGTTVTAPGDAPLTVESASVGTSNVDFSDNFETDQGWTTTNNGASSGDWQRGVPVNDPSWAYDPAADSDGSGQCYLTQNELGNTDVDGGSVSLISPVLDLSTMTAIRYDYYLNLTNPSGDQLLVEVDENDGNWMTLIQHQTSGGTAWRSVELTLADFAAAGVTPSATMRLRYTANDADPQSINEAGLDAFEVVRVTCVNPGTCTGDFDSDGVIGLSDLAILLANFGGNGAGILGDTDGDNDVDLTDLATLLSIFGTNCP